MSGGVNVWENGHRRGDDNDGCPLLYRLWRHGVYLWEIEAAYLEAMQVLEEAVLNIPYVATEAAADDHAFQQLQLQQQFQSADDETLLLSPRYRSREIESNATELLLFLAGCFLDAQDYTKARLYCRCAWLGSQNSTTASSSSSPSFSAAPILQRILSEYMSCYEEDPSLEAPWKKSYQILQRALDLVKLEEQEQEQTVDSSSYATTANSLFLWHSPWQRPAFCYPIRDFKIPVCPRDQHPLWCRQLEDQYPMILEEFLQLCRCPPRNNVKSTSLFPNHWPRVGAGSHREGAGSHDGAVVSGGSSDDRDGEGGGDWREFVLFGSGQSSAAEEGGGAPRTRAWLRKHAPDAVHLAQQGGGEIIFSVLRAKTYLAPHCASTNLRWTAHLGLVGCSNQNDGAKIRVADEWYTWKEGQVFVFDDSYEHEVRNDSSHHHRAVLLLRFWHPGIPKTERTEALQQALGWKQLEEERRYHPPLPMTG